MEDCRGRDLQIHRTDAHLGSDQGVKLSGAGLVKVKDRAGSKVLQKSMEPRVRPALLGGGLSRGNECKPTAHLLLKAYYRDHDLLIRRIEAASQPFIFAAGAALDDAQQVGVENDHDPVERTAGLSDCR